jgi:HEAT repeat protein
LETASWTTRFRAARLLGEIGDGRAIPALKKILVKKREKRQVREIIKEALGKLQNKNGA